MRVCFLLKNLCIKFHIRLCLQVHDSRCALVLFTDFTLKLCNSYVVSAANVVSLSLKTLYKRLFIGASFSIEKWMKVFIMWNTYEIMRHELCCRCNVLVLAHGTTRLPKIPKIQSMFFFFPKIEFLSSIHRALLSDYEMVNSMVSFGLAQEFSNAINFDR